MFFVFGGSFFGSWEGHISWKLNELESNWNICKRIYTNGMCIVQYNASNKTIEHYLVIYENFVIFALSLPGNA